MRIIFHTQRISAILQESNSRFSIYQIQSDYSHLLLSWIPDYCYIFSDVKGSNLATRRKKSILLCNTRGSETSSISTDSSKFYFTFWHKQRARGATLKPRKNLYVRINGIYRGWKLRKIVLRSLRKSVLAHEMSRDTSRTFLRTRNFYGGKHICNARDTRHIYIICSSIKASKVMSDSVDFSRFNVRDSSNTRYIRCRLPRGIAIWYTTTWVHERTGEFTHNNSELFARNSGVSFHFATGHSRYYNGKQKRQLETHKREATYSGNKRTIICRRDWVPRDHTSVSYVLSRPGSVRSVDRSRL